MVNPFVEGARLISAALKDPRIQQMLGSKVKQYAKQASSSSSSSTASAAGAGAGASSSASSSGTSHAGTVGGGFKPFTDRFNNWRSHRDQILQFLLVNFMTVMVIFQIASSVYTNYMKEKKMRDARKERDLLQQQQRSLVTEQMAEQQKMRMLQSSKSSSSGSASSAAGGGGGQLSALKMAELKRREQELHERMHEMSIAAVQRPISGVGVADVSGLDVGQLHTADIPVQVWVTDSSNAPPFDPLVRWQVTTEPHDRSYDTLGQRWFARSG